MSQESEVLEWKGHLARGKKYREKFYTEGDMLRFQNYFDNIFPLGTQRWDSKNDPEDRSFVPVNLAATIGRQMVRQVYYKNPRVIVVPRKVEFQAHARVLQNITNAIIRKIMLKREMRMGIQDTYTLGTGIFKVGYDSEFGFSDEVLQSTEPLEGSATDQGKKGELIEYRSNVFSGMPWALRAHPNDFVVPWDTRELTSAPWAVHWFVRPLADVRADPKLNSTGLEEDAEATAIMAELDIGIDPAGIPGGTVKMVALAEIHDLREGRVRVLAKNHKRWLRDEEDVIATEIGHLPFHSLIFNPRSQHFWGTSDVHTIEPQLMELNDIRTQDMKQRRISIAHLLYNKALIEEEELEKLVSEDVGAAVAVDGNPGEVATFMQYHQGPDMITASNTVQGDIRAMVGFSRNQLGTGMGGRRTATEIGEISQAFDVGIGGRRDDVNDVIIAIAEDIAQLIFAFWTEPRVASRVPGPGGNLFDVTYTGPQLRAKYDFQIGAEDSRPVDSTSRKKEAVELINALKGIEGLDIGGMVKQILGGAYEGIEFDQFQSQQQPQAQSMEQFGQTVQGGAAGANAGL